MLHANEHSPTKWPVHSPVSLLLPYFPPLPALTLLPAVLRLTHPQEKNVGSQLPFHIGGQFYLTGGKIHLA